TIIPASNRVGSATITLLVCDGQASGSVIFTATFLPINHAPVLTAISNQVINEGSLLTFTATATDPDGGVTNALTDFQNFSSGTANGTVLFRDPRNSGSTSSFLDSTPNLTSVTNVFPPGNSSTRVLRATWSFTNTAVNPWLRLTTFNTANLLNPTIPVNQILQFD